MELLPVEVWEIVFENILLDSPSELCRLRAVSRIWRQMIDQYISRSFKLWCKVWRIDDIPENCLNDILRTQFPLSAWSWQKLYWKDTRAAHIPSRVNHIWHNLRSLTQKQYNVSKFSTNLTHFGRFYELAVHEKYVAVSYGSADEGYRTCVYEFHNLIQPIRKWSLHCKHIRFYSEDSQTFIVLEASDGTSSATSVHLSDFVKDDRLLPSNLKGRADKDYAIVENVCFSIDESVVTHQILTPEGFKPCSKIKLPINGATDKVTNIQIDGCDLQFIVMAIGGEDEILIFKYKINRTSYGQLSFAPHDVNFFQEVDPTRFPGRGAIKPKQAYIQASSATYLKIESWPTLISIKNEYQLRHNIFSMMSTFQHWFWKIYKVLISSMVLCANYLIIGSSSGKIMIFKGTIEESLETLLEPRRTISCLKQPGVIFLEQNDISSPSIDFLDLVFVESRPKIIARNQHNIFFIDFFL